MSRFYMLNLHRHCAHDGCPKTSTHSVTDAQEGEIGTFCETHAWKLTLELNTEEDWHIACHQPGQPCERQRQ